MTRDNDAIDVIVRTGGRPAALLERAVSSLAQQSAGSIRLLLVRHGPADVEALKTLIGGALRGMQVIEAPGANRGRAMAAGVARVSAPHFALLDDDDYLLPEHFEHLLQAAQTVAGPAFAYGDILVQDEAAAPGEGLRLFREGPAEPPLGRITDRISAHSFLAERTALEGLPFAEWGLATAEDALLVASLLARSTPVHSPHATCVYVQGRGDASAYLAHPQRAADELSFARAVAPFREAIEAKFGAPQMLDEAAYLGPFIAAAKHAALFAELKQRRSGGQLLAVRDDELATPVAEDLALALLPTRLAFQAEAGRVAVGLGGSVEIEADADYAYAARMPLDIPAATRPVVVAVRVSSPEGAFGIALAGADHALMAETRVDPTPMAVEVQLPWERPEPPALIVRRLNALNTARPYLRVESVTLAFPCAALAPNADRVAAQAALASLAQAPRTIISPALSAPPSVVGAQVAGTAAIKIELGEAPWAYAFSAPLSPETADAALRVDLGPTNLSVFILRVDEAWAAVGERVEVPPAARASTIWLEPLSHGAATRLVIQAGPAPSHERVTLEGVFLYPAG